MTTTRRDLEFAIMRLVAAEINVSHSSNSAIRANREPEMKLARGRIDELLTELFPGQNKELYGFEL